MNTENQDIWSLGSLQGDSAEHEGLAGAWSTVPREDRETGGTDLLERILDGDNLDRAFRKVKANHGAPGIDGMTIEEAQQWLRTNRDDLVDRLRRGKYTPAPVRRKEIPKKDGGVRKLGIPTVVDRVIQQAITQQLTPIFEPLFAESSYGYRPGRSGPQAMYVVKGHVEEGYKWVASIDLSKYFDTLNHDLLLNMLRQHVKDERVVQLIKKYLKAGVMEDGVVMPTEEGSPQGGNISPLLANIYLNSFDHLMLERGVREVRYADDIILLAKSKRAAQRIMANALKYLEGRLKLKTNADKSKVLSAFSTEFKYLGYGMGKNGSGVFITAHKKSLKRAKDRLRELTRRNQGRNISVVMDSVRTYVRGWLEHYGIAELKGQMRRWDSWLRRRFRCYLWKQWKTVKGRMRALMALGVDKDKAYAYACTRKGYWVIAGSPIMATTVRNEMLKQIGYFNLTDYYVAQKRKRSQAI